MPSTKEQKVYEAWRWRKRSAAKRGVEFTEPEPPKPQTQTRKADSTFSVKRLLQRKRGLEIRADLLSKSVFYDGWEADVAANNNQLRDVHDLLRQAA